MGKAHGTLYLQANLEKDLRNDIIGDVSSYVEALDTDRQCLELNSVIAFLLVSIDSGMDVCVDVVYGVSAYSAACMFVSLPLRIHYHGLSS